MASCNTITGQMTEMSQRKTIQALDSCVTSRVASLADFTRS